MNKGSWLDVIKQCIELRTFPTIVFYERLNPNEHDPHFLAEAQLDVREIVKLYRESKNLNNEFSDFGGGFSQEEMLE